jgi:hypothetical protein
VGDRYDEFVLAARGLIAALAERVERENNGLYALVDTLYTAPSLRPSG